MSVDRHELSSLTPACCLILGCESVCVWYDTSRRTAWEIDGRPWLWDEMKNLFDGESYRKTQRREVGMVETDEVREWSDTSCLYFFFLFQSWWCFHLTAKGPHSLYHIHGLISITVALPLEVSHTQILTLFILSNPALFGSAWSELLYSIETVTFIVKGALGASTQTRFGKNALSSVTGGISKHRNSPYHY